MTTNKLFLHSMAVNILLAFSLSACTQPKTSKPLFTELSISPLMVGNNPYSMVVGDFNRDGYQDLAIANANSNDITILLGGNTLGFREAIGSPITIGTTPTTIVMGNLNGDDNPDLAIAYSTNHNVTVLLGDGTGRFTEDPNRPIASDSRTYSIALGDFNKDGNSDIAIANLLLGTITVLLGDGTGGFMSAANSPFIAGDSPYSIVVEDINLDGNQDIIATNISSCTIMVLLGDGLGGFKTTKESKLANGKLPKSIALGDFNGDGKPDLAVANTGNNSISVLLGNGEGEFNLANGSPYPTGGSPISLVVRDFNKDNELDIVSANFISRTLTILLGNGNGKFIYAKSSPFSLSSAPWYMMLVDFNKDSKPDLAIANGKNNDLTLLLNTQSNYAISGDKALTEEMSKYTGVEVSKGLNDYDQRMKDKVAPLIRSAALSGDLTEVRGILKNFPNLIDVPDEDGYTALGIACLKGHTKVVHELIEAGADVDIKVGKLGTPLIIASSLGYQDIIRLLLSADADVNAKTEDGFTALMIASNNGYKVILELLKKAGAKE